MSNTLWHPLPGLTTPPCPPQLLPDLPADREGPRPQMQRKLPALRGRQRQGRRPHHGCGLPPERAGRAAALRSSARHSARTTCCSTFTITHLPALAAVTPLLSHPLKARDVQKLNGSINRSIYLYCSAFIISMFVHFPPQPVGESNQTSFGVQYLCIADFIFIRRQI